MPAPAGAHAIGARRRPLQVGRYRGQQLAPVVVRFELVAEEGLAVGDGHPHAVGEFGGFEMHGEDGPALVQGELELLPAHLGRHRLRGHEEEQQVTAA